MTEDIQNLSVAELRQMGVPPKQILAEMKRRGMSNRDFIEAWSPKPPISSRVGSRSLRRKVVVAMYGSYLLIALGMQLSFQASGRWMTAGLGVLAVVAVAAATVANGWLGRRTYVNAPQLEDRELDERLVQIKNQAYRTAYKIITPLVLVAGPLAYFLLSIEPGGHGISHAILIYGGLALLVATLPTAIVAWREPDPEP
ncbi:MAG: hypothetical protein M3003_10270 [Candidatus Dormibacteraeota bacterium]|nr:hypothetical protein [Candidatus Dormibacteraeota bacterium]